MLNRERGEGNGGMMQRPHPVSTGMQPHRQADSRPGRSVAGTTPWSLKNGKPGKKGAQFPCRGAAPPACLPAPLLPNQLACPSAATRPARCTFAWESTGCCRVKEGDSLG
jgi:hypothetical protein